MSNESSYWTSTKASMESEVDLPTFKNWDTVRAIPIYKDNEFPIPYSAEVEYMLSGRSTAEKELWKKCLKEPALGHSVASYKLAQWPILGNTPSTSWVLKSAHHVLTHEALSSRSILSYDQIVEFGAGIGETARLITDLGFRGNYYILDLPEVARISEFYLQGRVGVCTRLHDIPRRENTLFIATWSLSEVPFDYRNEVVTYFRGSDFLIVFQNEIFGYDNHDYFTQVFPELSGTSIRLHPIVWHRGAKGNWYLSAKPHDGTEVTKSTPDSHQSPAYDLAPLREYRIRTALHMLARLPRAVWRRRHRFMRYVAVTRPRR